MRSAKDSALKNCGLFALPKFTFLLGGGEGLKAVTGKYLIAIFAAYVPVAFVVFAEHLADHKNLSSIVGQDLLENPGLTRTLLGDGVGSIAGAFFGGCPNTTYGESIALRCLEYFGQATECGNLQGFDEKQRKELASYTQQLDALCIVLVNHQQ